jgi:cbb3-type cytochrome oxidase subunit 3
MTFDINLFRGAAAAILLLSFVLLMIYIALPKNKAIFEAHAKIPLEDDQSAADSSRSH